MNANDSISKKTLSAAITAALMASGTGQVALAQDRDEEAAGAVEEIIVTATRREMTIQEIPYNISAISGATLENAQIVSSTELMRAIPGATVVDRGYRNSGVINSIMIRGLNVDGSAFGDYALSTVPTVSTYVNDIPVFANFIIKDLDRVEVLRGPQGTLYGSGSLGGTVKYILNEPELGEFSGKVEGRFSVTDGSGGSNTGADVILNFPLGDSAAVRVSAGMLDNDGIVDAPNFYVLDANRVPVAPDGVLAGTAQYRSLADVDTVDIDYLRVTALLEPNEKFRALFSYQTQDDDIGGRRHITRGMDGWGDPYGQYQIGSIQPEPSEREVEVAGLEMEIDLGFATLTSSTSVYDHSGSSISENTGFYAQLNWLGAFYYNYPRPMAEASRTYVDEATIQEFRLVSNGDGPTDWILGLFYRDQDTYSTQNSYLRGFYNWTAELWGCCVIDDNDFRYARDENFKDKAIFGEVTYEVSDTLRLTGGFRYFDNEYLNNTDMGVGLYTSFHFDDMARFEGSDSDTLFKFNLAKDLDDDKMFYATISEGFRRGGANAVPLSGIFAESPLWQQYGPDTVTNYEFGLKGMHGEMRYNVSLFYVDWEDIQLNVATTNWGFFAAQNGGNASTKGLELELDGYAEGGIHWGIGYAYVDAQLDDNLYSPTDLGRQFPTALEGDRLPGTSEHTINFALDHTHDMANGLTLFSRVGGYFQSATENAISTSQRFKQTLQGFALFDFSTSVVDENWSVTFFIKNLFNEEGITGLFKEEYMGTDPAQNYYGNGSKQFISLPRTIGLSATYDF